MENFSDHFSKYFFKNESNLWILKFPRVLKAIQALFKSMDVNTLKALLKIDFAIVTCQGLWASTINPQKKLYLIIVFPNLLDLLDSLNYRIGLAVLAHEIGHIFLEHAKKDLSELEEQFEADLFAVNLGFERELLEFLSFYPNSNECNIRKDKIIQRSKSASFNSLISSR